MAAPLCCLGPEFYGTTSVSAVPALVIALKDTDPEVRRDAAYALSRIGKHAAPATPALMIAFKEADKGVRDYIGSTLIDIGALAVPGLTAMLKDTDKDVRIAAASILGNIGKPAFPAVPVLIGMLKDTDPEVRGAAAEVLGRMEAPSSLTPAIVAALMTTLKDKVPEVRRRAVAILGYIGKPAAAAIPALTNMLKEPYVSFDAAVALSYIDKRASVAVVRILVQGAGGFGDNRDRRRVAISAMRKLGAPASAAVVHALIGALGDQGFLGSSGTAAETLQIIGAPVVPALIDVLKSDDPVYRYAAINILGRIGAPADSRHTGADGGSQRR